MKLLLRVLFLGVFFLFLEGPLSNFVSQVLSVSNSTTFWISLALKLFVLVSGLKFIDKMSK